MRRPLIVILPLPARHQPYFAQMEPSALIVARVPPLGSRPDNRDQEEQESTVHHVRYTEGVPLVPARSILG